jgi:nucleoside-diphosphate-sugar epimerase
MSEGDARSADTPVARLRQDPAPTGRDRGGTAPVTSGRFCGVIEGMRILVLGATGVAGRSTLPALVEAGHAVWGHARGQENATLVRRLGAEPVAGDAEDIGTLRRWLHGKHAVIDLRVRIPTVNRAMLPWAWREYVHLRDTAAGQVVDAAIAAGVPVVVHDTVTMVYADGGDTLLDECSPVDASGPLTANLAAERHLERLAASGGRGVALRFGQFYGPDDLTSRELLHRAARGQAMVLGDPAGWTSAVHTDDVGPAVLAALTAPAGVYNVVDDEPMRRSDVLALLAGVVGRTSLRQPPAFLAGLANAPVKALARSQRVTSERFRELTGWAPHVPSRRTGWPEAAERVRTGI